MKGTQGVARTEIERVKQDEDARVVALKRKHKVEVRRLNELLEQSRL